LRRANNDDLQSRYQIFEKERDGLILQVDNMRSAHILETAAFKAKRYRYALELFRLKNKMSGIITERSAESAVKESDVT
jgi:hypothetical protein